MRVKDSITLNTFNEDNAGNDDDTGNNTSNNTDKNTDKNISKNTSKNKTTGENDQ